MMCDQIVARTFLRTPTPAEETQNLTRIAGRLYDMSLFENRSPCNSAHCSF